MRRTILSTTTEEKRVRKGEGEGERIGREEEEEGTLGEEDCGRIRTFVSSETPWEKGENASSAFTRDDDDDKNGSHQEGENVHPKTRGGERVSIGCVLLAERRFRVSGANDGGVVSHQSEADVPGGRGFGGRRTERGQ